MACLLRQAAYSFSCHHEVPSFHGSNREDERSGAPGDRYVVEAALEPRVCQLQRSCGAGIVSGADCGASLHCSRRSKDSSPYEGGH